MAESERSARARSAGSASSWTRAAGRAVGWLFGLALAGALSAFMLVAIALAVAYPNLPELDGLMDYRPKQPMRVYAADGELIGEFGEERRRFVPIEQIPKVMQIGRAHV